MIGSAASVEKCITTCATNIAKRFGRNQNWFYCCRADNMRLRPMTSDSFYPIYKFCESIDIVIGATGCRRKCKMATNTAFLPKYTHEKCGECMRCSRHGSHSTDTKHKKNKSTTTKNVDCKLCKTGLTYSTIFRHFRSRTCVACNFIYYYYDYFKM